MSTISLNTPRPGLAAGAGRQSPLGAFFAPRTVAVVGATETPGSVGRTLFANLTGGSFGGTAIPVNPHRPSVLGHRSYASVSAIPGSVDLAVIATRAATVPDAVRDCAEARVKNAVIISAGFRETGAAGLELEQQVLAEARRGGMRLIGPNCLGIMNPLIGLNATFAANTAHPGSVAFLSQSGALCTSILDWSLRENVGFSAFVSVGSMLDVGWGDLIDYFADDPNTKSIIMYMESIGDARSFLSAAREVALSKPVIVVKTGRTGAAAKAAASHTGSLAGSDDVLDAAFRRCGVLRVDRISDLFYLAEILAMQPRPRGPRLTIVSNAGGPAVMATDALIAAGGQIAQLSPETIEALNGVLPKHWSHQNPVDIIGDATADRYAAAMEIAARDPNTDGFLIVLSPQGMTNPTEIAERLKRYAKLTGKPVLASWMGGSQVAAGQRILQSAGIPTFPYPDTAARLFHDMWRYSSNLQSLYETPAYPKEAEDIDAARARAVIDAARGAGRELLTEVESKEILAAYGIPAPATRLASSEEEAVQLAAGIGYPVVLKLHSLTVTHKSDIGGVRLNLGDEAAVREAYAAIQRAAAGAFQGVTVQPMVRAKGYELILGSSVDPQFGPVLLFGSGGELVEVMQDRALALPPLNTTLALRMMERTRIFRALPGVRGRQPVDLHALAQLVVRFSRLVTEQPWIKEIDINPLLASAGQLLALDARIILHPPQTKESALPRTAIRPYPAHYSRPAVLKNGTEVLLRPIRPEDEPMMIRFHLTLQDESVYLRYFHFFQLDARIAHDRLTRQCFIDYDREIALVAQLTGADGAREIIGVARMKRLRGRNEAEIAVIVSDAYHNLGAATQLIRLLVEVAREEKLDRLLAVMLAENLAMQHLLARAGFAVRYSEPDQVVQAELRL
ncbi:MAG TPA: bifunctional acetate--CoA ligase family protein/GNAT family N-acetyltransferase [Bryobacteraceae bacterium]|nr:bifunctional acetate--CoA ligase family protein/GNAT family N-acetyltransferase [Bryobacteraceae bacterium]